MKTKCVVYARVSSITQDTQSQLTAVEKYAKNNDFEIVKTFTEKLTGYTDKRTKKQNKDSQLEALKEFITENNIKHVLSFELSRIGRTARKTLEHIEYFKSNGVDLYLVKENINTLSDSPTTKLILTVYAGVAEMEGESIRIRTQGGMHESVKNGKKMGFSVMPLGYLADENGFLHINEKEAELVRHIYNSVAAGTSANRLAKDFNDDNVPTSREKRGKKRMLKNGTFIETEWNAKTIKNMVKSTRYKGKRTYGKEIYDVPRIVSDDLWEEANKRIDEHTGKIEKTTYEYLAKSRIICGQCGYILKGLRKYSKKKEDVQYYTCMSYLHTHINCDCGRFRSQVFDGFLYKILFDYSKGLLVIQQKGDAEGEVKKGLAKIESHNQDKSILLKEKDRVLTLYKKGFISEIEMEKDYARINKGIIKVEAQIRKLNQEIKQFESSEKPFMQKVLDLYWNSNFDKRRKFIQNYVQRITVFKVKKVDFDLTRFSAVTTEATEDRVEYKQGERFKSPLKNEVIWYTEIQAFNQTIKSLMTSGTKTLFVNDSLEFDATNRKISLAY